MFYIGEVPGVASGIYLRKDGTEALTANWDAGNFQIQAKQFYADTDGTAGGVTMGATNQATLACNAGVLDLQEGAGYDITCFKSAAEGETPEVQIGGFKTGDSLRTLAIGISSATDDAAAITGLSKYYFTGSLGIGTTNPSDELHVKAESTPFQRVEFTSTGSWGGFAFYQSGAQGACFQLLGSTFSTANRQRALEICTNQATGQIIFRPGSNAEAARFDANGNFGINAVPSGTYKLECDGNAYFSGTSGYIEITDGITAPGAGAGARIYVDTADGDLKVVYSDSTVKTIVVDT